MNHVRGAWIPAVLCLAFAGVAPAQTQGQAVRVSIKEPALRSSAALVLDTTHDSVLYSRRSGIALPRSEERRVGKECA